MKLFFSPGACSLVPHIALRETGTPFTLSKVDLARHLTTTGDDYYAINIKGQVPVLELDDGAHLTEGPVIVQYIADRADAMNFMPPTGSMARYRVMEWQNYITSELHKSFSPLFNPEFDATAKALHSRLLRKKFEWVDQQLAGTPYLTGEHFTAADAYLFTVAGWARHVNLNLADLPNLQRFLAAVGARPAVHDAMKTEGLIA